MAKQTEPDYYPAQDDMLKSRRGAPAFGLSSHQNYKEGRARVPGETVPGGFQRRQRDVAGGTDNSSYFSYVDGSGEQFYEQSTSVLCQKRCGGQDGYQRRSSCGRPSVVAKRSEIYSPAAGGRQPAEKQVNMDKTL